MLSQRYPPEKLKTILLPRERWHPFPKADNRDAWLSLPPLVREAYLAFGEEAIDYQWPELQAVRFLDFARNGNRIRYETPHFERRAVLGGLVLAECFDGQGRFVDDIVNGVWAICEESYWGVPAHVGVQAAGVDLPDVTEPTVDLFAAETAALLAWTDYLLGPQLDAVSPLIRQRIQVEMDRKMLQPCFERDDFWWMGFRLRSDLRRVNNWNPWICSNWLTTALLMEKDAERRLATVVKILTTVDHFIDPYPTDGGCDEGPSYWGRAGASLFDNLELLHSASDGQIDLYDEPLIQNIGQFIYRAHIADRYYVNFADAPAVVEPNPYIVFQYGQRIGDSDMAAMGRWLADQRQLFERGFALFNRQKGRVVPTSLGRQLPALFALSEMQNLEPRQPLPRDVWLDQIEVMTARTETGSRAGLYLAAKGGHNNESHNHNDIGTFVVYSDGRPLLIDAGVETYTKKTFSPQRYEIWTMQSAYHNLPTINGVMQAPGEAFQATKVNYQADDESAQLRLDLAPAYPSEAKLKTWLRTVRLNRGENVEIVDAYELAEISQPVTINLMTASTVSLDSDGLISLTPAPIADDHVTAAGRIEYPANIFTVTTETILITDERLGNIWGTQLTRIIFTVENAELQGRWTWLISGVK